jgi:hypothetical protein
MSRRMRSGCSNRGLTCRNTSCRTSNDGFSEMLKPAREQACKQGVSQTPERSESRRKVFTEHQGLSKQNLRVLTSVSVKVDGVRAVELQPFRVHDEHWDFDAVLKKIEQGQRNSCALGRNKLGLQSAIPQATPTAAHNPHGNCVTARSYAQSQHCNKETEEGSPCSGRRLG